MLIIAPSTKQEMCARVLYAQRNSIPYIFKAGHQIEALSSEELTYIAFGAKCIMFNDYEWDIFHHKTDLAPGDLSAKGVVVIITLGNKGTLLHTDSQMSEIEAVQSSEVVDTTGVGDAYAGAVAAGCAYGFDWLTACRVASTLASFVVEHRGTQEYAINKMLFNERYTKHFDDQNPFHTHTDYRFNPKDTLKF